MFEQISDSYRKATESSLYTQKGVFRQWVQQWPSKQLWLGGSSLERSEESQSRWRQALSEALARNRELLDFAYRSGLRTIDQTLSIARAKSSDELRRLSDELWRNLTSIKTRSEGQLRLLQAASERIFGSKPAVSSAP